MTDSSPFPGRVLVTSGPTRAYFDRIRYIANTSSGLLGAHIVQALIGQGMHVIHLRGEGSAEANVADNSLLESITITTVDDLIREVRRCASEGQVSAIVHAMAVLDYVPAERIQGKVPSGAEEWNIRLQKTPKVAAIMRELMSDALMVGFKLEAGSADNVLVERSLEQIRKYQLDLVVANDINRVGPIHHEALLVNPNGDLYAQAETKTEIASLVAQFICDRLAGSR